MPFPGFRHVDPALTPLAPPQQDKVIMLADDDFAPWSFLDENGKLQGISVELAALACMDAGLNCELRAVPYQEILPIMRRNEAHGFVSGPKLDAAVANEFSLTRPYFQSLGRFAARSGSSLSAPDIRTLAGRRIGFRANSAHGRFLEIYYSRSALTPFDNNDDMLEALRTGQVDAVFGDAIQLSYWLSGSRSRGCCTFLGKAFLHRDTFSRSLSIVTKRDAAQMRAHLDMALDRLETKGATAEIFARYLPSNIW